MSEDFETLYAHTGRPGIAPEMLLQGLLLQAFYSIRSKRHLMGQLEFNLLFRWFVGLGIDERVWDATVGFGVKRGTWAAKTAKPADQTKSTYPTGSSFKAP